MIKKYSNLILITLFIIFLVISFFTEFEPGKEMGNNFFSFLKNLGLLLPPVFVLIGLFDVWVKSETIEKHLGQQSGFVSYLYMILLSSTMVGGMIVAFPVAFSLLNKGAKSSVVYTFLFSSAICRIPMTFFEASYLGIKFTAIRLGVSLPLILLASLFMGKYFKLSSQSKE